MARKCGGRYGSGMNRTLRSRTVPLPVAGVGQQTSGRLRAVPEYCHYLLSTLHRISLAPKGSTDVRDTEWIVTQWVSGVSIPPVPAAAESFGTQTFPIGTIRTVVVVETDEWIPALVSAGVVDAHAALIHRGETPAIAAGWSRTYLGTFSDPVGDVVFADGFRLRQTRYGLADFSCLDTPTALVLVDEHDFSAFLRDADVAWGTGVFANHVTHPLAVLANVDALGAAIGRSGPDHRLFVGSDGSISTSPFGSTLGRASENPAMFTAGWDAAHVGEPVDAVSLRKSLRSNDRIDALIERPWLPRYFEVIAAIRSIRIDHLEPGRVSGFGGRLATSRVAAGPVSDSPDGCGLPILIELGDAVRAIDPTTGAWTLLTRAEVAAAEQVLVRPAGATRPPDIADLVRTVDAAGLPTDWFFDRVPPRTGGQEP